jgi:hypothetical protein
LRTLEANREAMAVREVARRAGLALRSAQIAVERLREVGILRGVGSGSRGLVEWNGEHPLSVALGALFEAETRRRDRILRGVTEILGNRGPVVLSAWMAESESTSVDLELGVLAAAGDVDRLVDELREELAPLMRRESIWIEVRGWTRADLEDATVRAVEHDAGVLHVAGAPLDAFLPRSEAPSRGPRSHREVDDDLRAKMQRVARSIRLRPEIVSTALEEIDARLSDAEPREAKTLREWRRILDTMSVERLARWLVEDSERADRLRQSIPATLLRSTDTDNDGPGSDR